MGKIWLMLKSGLLTGVLTAGVLVGFAGVFYLLHRLWRWLRPGKEGARPRFYAVSGRGRAAYFLLCLEEALRFYGQDFAAWEGVLRELWSITDCAEERWLDNWLNAAWRFLPSSVLAYRTFAQAAADGWDPSGEGEFQQLRQLYTEYGAAMAVLNPLLQNVYDMAAEWDPSTTAHDPGALLRIAEAEEVMRSFGVPLPSGPPVEFLLRQKDASMGSPFDGLRLSALSR